MTKPSADGVARVFTPPWNKKRLPPNSPHGTRHAAAVNAAAANAAAAGAEWSSPALGRVDEPGGVHRGAGEGARSPLSPQRGPYEKGLAHGSRADERSLGQKSYPVVSLSTQMAQVLSRISRSLCFDALSQHNILIHCKWRSACVSRSVIAIGSAQVMSPAKPDFSPSAGMGQRRRLCAVLEGIAEKHDVCYAAMQSFQVCSLP